MTKNILLKLITVKITVTIAIVTIKTITLLLFYNAWLFTYRKEFIMNKKELAKILYALQIVFGKVRGINLFEKLIKYIIS